MSTVVICSGGLDSITLAYQVKAQGAIARLVSFDYGQRHKVELRFAARAAHDLGVPHDMIDISGLTRFLAGSALTDDIDVPDGHYAQDNMQITVVPNRNAIFLAIAYGVAAGEKASSVAAAFHSGDHFVYPDCRPAFVDAFRVMQNHATEGLWEIDLHAPFVEASKADIVKIGSGLGVPFEKTWSCYKGGARHCGRCGTCVERLEAFYLTGVTDPTAYEDR
ncbi:MAG: 7-cyano-7-deazaguanine synthase QueC, partial [Alphaproteobacteria bacterium]|nr:7-cyano-7-deazaguanine synthase QueC [Alphaproteobacteria bacterium]